MIVAAPASRAPATDASPTPPHPMTATMSPRPTPPVLIAAPSPAITPQPSSPATSGVGRGSTLVHWPAATSVLSANAPMPRAGRQLRAVLEGHLLLGVVGVEAVPGTPAQAGPALPAHRPPVQDHEVAGLDLGDPVADLLDDSGGLVPEQEGELVVDAALAVVQVGVADPARLDRHDRLPGPGSGTMIVSMRTGSSPARCDDPAYLLRHAASHGLRRVPDPTHPGMPVSSGSGERAGQMKRMAWSLSAVSRSRTVTPAAGGRGPPPRARAMSGRQAAAVAGERRGGDHAAAGVLAGAGGGGIDVDEDQVQVVAAPVRHPRE